MNIETMELVAGVAMVVVAISVPKFIARRIKHGEARFDRDGKLIDNE